MDALLNIDDKKVFIKGFAQNVTIDDLQGHFKSYGRIISTIIEEVEGVRRGSIEFNDYSSIDLLILDEKEHKIKGKIVELQFSLLGSANIPLATSRPSILLSKNIYFDLNLRKNFLRRTTETSCCTSQSTCII